MLPHPQSWQRQTRYDVLAAAKGPPGHRMRRASRDDFAPAPAPAPAYTIFPELKEALGLIQKEVTERLLGMMREALE